MEKHIFNNIVRWSHSHSQSISVVIALSRWLFSSRPHTNTPSSESYVFTGRLFSELQQEWTWIFPSNLNWHCVRVSWSFSSNSHPRYRLAPPFVHLTDLNLISEQRILHLTTSQVNQLGQGSKHSVSTRIGAVIIFVNSISFMVKQFVCSLRISLRAV